MKSIMKFVGFLLIVNLITACSGGEMENNDNINNVLKNISSEKWKKLEQQKIYFGHQSVGFNIVDGIKDVINESKVFQLNIVETKNIKAKEEGIFAHSTIGENKKPVAKIEDFKKNAKNGIGTNANIASFKFCFVDINADTNVDEIFKKYEDTIVELEKKYPETKFVHFTVPLTVIQEGIKAKIKKLLGKPLGGYADNQKRNQFNNLLLKRFSDAPVFDLAKIEATYPDGRMYTFDTEGEKNFALISEYSDDGAHLNEYGRKFVAGQLLKFLSDL